MSRKEQSLSPDTTTPRLSPCPAAAFSLIEVVTVIAIIAILAALLFALSNRARNQAAETADLSNLHQIMMAVQVYANDNGNVMTWPNWDYGGAMPDGTARAGWLYKPNLSASGPAVYDGQASLLWDFLRSGRVLLCPMDLPAKPVFSPHYGRVAARPQQLSSYTMNGAVIGFQTGYCSNAIPVKATQLLPHDSILWELDDREPYFFRDGANCPFDGITTRHSQGGAQASLDGSADHIRYDTWYDEVYEANKNGQWCYPYTSDGGDPAYGHTIPNR